MASRTIALMLPAPLRMRFSKECKFLQHFNLIFIHIKSVAWFDSTVVAEEWCTRYADVACAWQRHASSETCERVPFARASA
jgi:hypothetical protein